MRTPQRELEETTTEGPLPTDDVLDRLLPLMRAVVAAHDEGRVANLEHLEGLTVDDEGSWSLSRAPMNPRSAAAEIARISGQDGAVEVVDRGTLRADIGAGSNSYTDHAIVAAGTEITHPAHLAGYATWEGAVGHRDALTDVFVLGLVLASLALGLDMAYEADHTAFVEARDNLFALVPDLNPVLARTIREMTEPDRRRRAQDLRGLVARLETYRDQPEDVDLADLEHAPPARYQELVFERLRNRLLDPSRRNRLLYFRPTQQTVDLTETSVPQRLDHKRIRAESLLTWHSAVADSLAGGKTLKLGSYLRFEDNPFLTGTLDKIISQARRDRADYGFAQLRMVISFLSWHDLRGAASEIIDSPLLLVPVELVRKKGVRDSYGLDSSAGVAEVNPSLRQRLADLYGTRLPERVELSEQAVSDFHAELTALIQASEPAVSLRLVDKPRIDLIQRQARVRAELFLRRRRAARGGQQRVITGHSYKTDDYRPLGIQLFLRSVKPAPLPQRSATDRVNEDYRLPAAVDGPVLEKSTYRLRKGARTGNPYEWEIDLCRVTLGNFNYRRMTLVQDYERLLRGTHQPSAFDAVFTLEGKPLDGLAATLPTAEQHLVVEGDSTQLRAVSQGRAGDSYIIQGPPGTGKSQTITNLIADFAAQGKRVLFVCEKRAAVDVVFHRLRQSGLDGLCCLIHDSQSDKRAFVLDLKATYEGYLNSEDSDSSLQGDRDAVVGQIDSELESLRRLSTAMNTVVPGTGLSVGNLLDDLITLRSEIGGEPELTDEQLDLLPAPEELTAVTPVARAIERSLTDVGETPLLAAHPVINLNAKILAGNRPQRAASELISRLRRQLDALAGAIDATGLPFDLTDDLQALTEFAKAASGALQPLQEAGCLDLLDPQSQRSRSFDPLGVAFEQATAAAVTADLAATGWHDRPPLPEAVAALDAAKRWNGKTLPGLHGAFRKARKLVAQSFGETTEIVPALELLVADRAARAAVHVLQEHCQQLLNTPDVDAVTRWVTDGRALRGFRVDDVSMAVSRPSGPQLAHLISDAGVIAQELEVAARSLTSLFADTAPVTGSVVHVLKALDALEAELDLLPVLTDDLRSLADGDPSALRALRGIPRSVSEVAFASGQQSLFQFLAADRALARLDGHSVEQRTEKLAELRGELLGINAALIRAGIRDRFREHIRITGLPAAQLDEPGKAFKKSYGAGRRELEHEFGKVMRYKSIREIVGGPGSQVVADLKPVWLMSPLSVSDTLPLRTDLFDVVIYDEASQIPVEEAVPALHRAPQVIVVGDQMQLPPTSFFSSSAVEDDDIDPLLDEVSVSLEGTSFLNQSATNLPSVLLAWHYRSRSEELIGFSNAAFYGGELRTVPNRTVDVKSRNDILVKNSKYTGEARSLIDRPISFHRIEGGIYAERRNTAEAGYVAELVRDLLTRDTGQSIGVVAFSEAQQSAIEDALSALAAKDADFALRLERETEREVDDQFVGLFVKNLENVQGDERDIIVLSICYAPDPSGRMRMNFGPINAADGEKRLNVIFSRAKHHMAVVSSIRHDAITNDWNDGANALKEFLRYAEASSRGASDLASAVLAGYLPRSRRLEGAKTQAVIAELAAALTKAGCLVDLDLGVSSLRCDLAIRLPRDKEHRVAVLLDHRTDTRTDEHEHWIDRPRAFAANGWTVAHVVTKDWLLDPDAVVERLLGKAGKTSLSRPAMPKARPPRAAVTNRASVASAAKPRVPRRTSDSPKPIPTAPQTAVSGVAAAPRRFEFVEGTSSKFWVGGIEDSKLVVSYGRIGTAGRRQSKTLASPEAAAGELQRLIREKLAKGYAEVGSDTSASDPA